MVVLVQTPEDELHYIFFFFHLFFFFSLAIRLIRVMGFISFAILKGRGGILQENIKKSKCAGILFYFILHTGKGMGMGEGIGVVMTYRWKHARKVH